MTQITDKLMRVARVIFFALLFSIFGTALGAPTAVAPASNIEGVIDVSGMAQSIVGGLEVGNGSVSDSQLGLRVSRGAMTVRTPQPSAGLKLDVEGQIGTRSLCDIAGINCAQIEQLSTNPPGMLLMFGDAAATCPTGWSRYDLLDGKYPRGAADVSSIGLTLEGDLVHNHDLYYVTEGYFRLSCPSRAYCENHYPYFNSQSTHNAGANPPVPDFTSTLFCKRNVAGP